MELIDRSGDFKLLLDPGLTTCRSIVTSDVGDLELHVEILLSKRSSDFKLLFDPGLTRSIVTSDELSIEGVELLSAERPGIVNEL